MKYLFTIIVFLFSIQFSFTQSEPDGPYKEYYKSGELRTEGQYLNEKRDGAWKGYHKNGQVAALFSYTKGKRDLEQTAYYDDGTLKYKTEKEGEIYVLRSYYKSGKLYYERALTNGYYKEFREDESLKVEANYRDNALYGKWKEYSTNGNLKWSVSYENGYRNGTYEQYHDNGQLKLKGIILKGKKKGEEKRYDANGNLTWKGDYENDKFAKTWIKYDENGNKVEKIKIKKDKDKMEITPTEVPDGVIERVAVFPGCEEVLGNKARKKCMNTNVNQLISSNFDINKAKNIGLTGKQRILVAFKVDKYGYVSIDRIKAPHPVLRIETQRVIQMLPRFTPANQRGKPVAMPFTVPIVFVVQ
jgi:antitoxin component YwqK of YwqJK toxin-antitoxin module